MISYVGCTPTLRSLVITLALVAACSETEPPQLGDDGLAVAPEICGYEVIQGRDSLFTIQAVTGTVPVETFYSYGSPVANSANTGFEVADRTAVLVYTDTTTGLTSLVITNDAASSDTGGQAVFDFKGIGKGTITVLDNPIDNYRIKKNTATAVWDWDAFSTDGIAITFPTSSMCVDITAQFVLGANGYSVYSGGTSISVDELTYAPTPLKICAAKC